MARIGIDCRFASARAGLGTYVRGVVPPLIESLNDHDVVLFVSNPQEDWVRSIKGSPDVTKVPAKHYSLAEQLVMPLMIRKSGIDLLFSPHFNVPLFCPVPYVAVIHDLILHRFPNDASLIKRSAYRLLISSTLRRAEAIIAVSEFTASELLNVYGKGIADRLTIIGEGVDPLFTRRSPEESRATLERYGLQPGFMLYVGNAKEHKNVRMLIDAHARVSDAPTLVLVTGGKEASELSIGNNVRIIPDVPHGDLPMLYSAARAFVTASLYEGFCLPILEARACGCPVIAVDRTAVPEIAGNHAVLVEPSVEALASAIGNPPSQSDPVGTAHDWRTVAAGIAGILKSSLHG